ncbi:hypothetical protein BgiBS90_007562 [Biomphalaria glabrata]|nr:hypothetical protein BgiBS90_007562 [Biomphalaria glabrata]
MTVPILINKFTNRLKTIKTRIFVSSPQSTFSGPVNAVTTRATPEEEVCCSGVLGYASDNVSLNFPCQDRPCCNSTETVAVVAIDYAMGFRFQCMPRSSIQPLCYEYGTEVRTSNQDPDFIPRACCPGLKFRVVLNQWYAALVIKCVEMDNNDDDYS